MKLPNLLKDWPWERRLNPHYDNEGCQLEMVQFFAIDAYTDETDQFVTKEMVDTIMDGLRNPSKPRPEGECLLGEMTRQ